MADADSTCPLVARVAGLMDDLLDPAPERLLLLETAFIDARGALLRGYVSLVALPLCIQPSPKVQGDDSGGPA